MYNKTLRIDGVDISRYVHKSGPQISYAPEYGLQDEVTIDGTIHTDYAGERMTIVIPFNPATPEQARYVSNLIRGGVKWLTYYDADKDEDVTIRCKPAPLKIDPVLTKAGEVALYKITNISFVNLDLT
jgi:hypothetical protein